MRSTQVACCKMVIHDDPDGGFWAEAVNLPGAASQGDTAHEAVLNLREAFTGVVESYLDRGEAIPWVPDDKIPSHPEPIPLWVQFSRSEEEDCDD